MNHPPNRRRNRSFWEKQLKRLGELLADDSSREKLFLRTKRAVRIILLLSAGGYGACLLLLIPLFHLVGESNLTLAFLLYLPRSIFILPAVALLPLALIFHWRVGIFVLICCFTFFAWGMDFHFRGVPNPSVSEPGKSLTVLTYNRGQHQNQSLKPFKDLTTPDVIALQESGGRAALYAAAEGYDLYSYTKDEGEFTLLSRYPILSSSVLTLPGHSTPHPPAARFEIDFNGTRIAIYSVHTLSPRDTLLYYRRGAFLYGIIGVPGTPFSAKRKANQVFWDQRVEEALALQRIVSADPLPTLVAGDFNAPAGGRIHRILRKNLEDAHLSSGHGFGYTFPGQTRNPLSLGGPWMRIDYLFCNAGWEPVWCITEKGRPSQHRAVTAQFRLSEAPR